MILNVGFLVVASAAVFTITRIRFMCPMTRKHPENKDSNIDSEKEEQEQDEAQQSPKRKLHLNDNKLKNSECVREIQFLKDAEPKMEKRREKLEVKLLEMYCLKQQHINKGDHLRQSLKSKILEIHILNATKTALQDDKERLKEEVKQSQLAENQLESARASLKEIQGQECVESAQLKRQLLMLKEQISGFGINEKNEFLELKEKLIATKISELELEAMEWKRKKKELQLDTRELGVKLVAAQTSITEFSRFFESIGELEAEKRRLMHSNEVFLDNIEKLQMSRFDMVQELVYQRWLSACLRFEIHESQTPRKQNRNKLSFESQEASSIFSDEIDETTGTTATSYSSSQTSAWRRYNLAQKLRKWAHIKNESDQRGLNSRFAMSSVPSSAPTRAKNVVTNYPNADNIKRLRRVSFSDSVRPSQMEFQDTRRSMNKEGNTKATTGYDKAIKKGILRRFSMSSVPADASSTPVENQVLDFSESSKTRRTKRVSLDDLLKQEPLACCNVTKSMDKYSDYEEISSKTYTSVTEFEMKNTQETSSRSPRKREDEIENQVSSKSWTLNVGLHEAKHSDQLMDVAAAAVIIIFFILLVFLFLSSICH